MNTPMLSGNVFRNKIAVGYLLWLVVAFPFTQVHFYRSSVAQSLVSLAILLVWFGISFVLVYYPLKRLSLPDSEVDGAGGASPYIAMGVFILYEIFSDYLTLNAGFMYKNFILKIIYHLFLICIVLVLGRYFLKIKAGELEHRWALIYTVLPLAIIGSTLDVIIKGRFEDFVFGLWGNVLRVIFAFVAAYYEELLYRGLVFKTLRRIFKSPFSAIVVSGIIFGLIHVAPWRNQPLIRQVLEVTTEKALDGMIFAYIYYKTKSLLPGTVLHAIKNLF